MVVLEELLNYEWKPTRLLSASAPTARNIFTLILQKLTYEAVASGDPATDEPRDADGCHVVGGGQQDPAPERDHWHEDDRALASKHVHQLAWRDVPQVLF